MKLELDICKHCDSQMRLIPLVVGGYYVCENTHFFWKGEIIKCPNYKNRVEGIFFDSRGYRISLDEDEDDSGSKGFFIGIGVIGLVGLSIYLLWDYELTRIIVINFINFFGRIVIRIF